MTQDTKRSIDVVAFGESMALFAADTPGDLAHVAHFTRSLAGADSNVAIGLARLGLAVDWTSRVGDDPFGRFIAHTLRCEGIDCDNLVIDPDRPTGIQFKSREIDGGDPSGFYRRAGSAATALAPASLSVARIAGARHLHVTGVTAAISDSTRALCHHAMDAMRAAGGTISFDPNLRPALWPDTATMVREINALAAKADWVLPGIDEGVVLTGRATAEAIATFYLDAGAREVAVKLGADGAYWQSADARLTAPGQPVAAVVDTVGAGDGFAVGFISARLAGLGPAAALARANAIAARVIGFVGDAEGLPDRPTLDALLSRCQDAAAG